MRWEILFKNFLNKKLIFGYYLIPFRLNVKTNL